jgi:hypothetical protein
MDKVGPRAQEARCVDVSAQRRSVVQRNSRNRVDFYKHVLGLNFDYSCNCMECSTSQHSVLALPCQADHVPYAIAIERNRRPGLVSELEHGAYDAMTLARSTIEYFSRPEECMDPKQRTATQLLRGMIKLDNVMGKLVAPDARNGVTDNMLAEYANMLNDILFFGAMRNLEIFWLDEGLQGEEETVGWLGLTQSYTFGGRRHHLIRLHPTHTEWPKSTYASLGRTLAKERQGTILHEMLHAFLDQFSCIHCRTYPESKEHGRAWQLVARAIEEQSLRLLGAEVYLGRLAAFFADRKAGTEYKPSIHDFDVVRFC